MGKVQLEISSNLQALMDKVDKLSGNVQKLTGQTDEFSQKSQQGFNKTTQSAKQLETEIKDQVKIIKQLENEYDKLGKTSSKHTKEQAAAYKRLKGDIVVAKNELISMNQQQANITSKGTQMFKQMGTAIAGAFAIGAVVAFSKESIAAYQGQLRAEAKLYQSLKGRESVAKALINQATQLQKTTLYNDDEIINAQAILSLNIKEEDQLKRLTPLVMDLAAAKNMDLASAAQAVNMAVMGQTRGLKGVGIQLAYTGDKASMLTAVMGALNKAVGGQSAAALSDQEKGLRQAAVAMEELKEAWGKVIISLANTGATDTFVGTLDNIRSILDDIGNGNIWEKLGGIGKWLGEGALAGQLVKTIGKDMLGSWFGWFDESKVSLEGVTDAGKVFEDSFMNIMNNINEKPVDPWAGIYDQGEKAINYALLTTDRLNEIRLGMTNKYGDLLLTGVESEDKANKDILDIINKELKYRDDAAKESERIEKDKQAKLKEIRDKEIKASENIGMKSIEVFKQQGKEYEAITSMLTGITTIQQKEVEKGALELRNTVSTSIDDIKKEIEETEQFSQDHPLFSQLGIKNEEQLSAVKDYVKQLSDFANEIIDQQVQATERIVEDQNQRIDEQQQLVEREYADKEAGLANNYALESENLKKMQKARDEAIKDRERMIKIQRIMSTTESGIALVSAAANIIKGFSSIPVVGVVLGLAAVGAMIAGFILATSKAKDATKMERGGLLSGNRHTQGGISMEAEDGEFFINRNSTAKHLPLLEAINRDDRESMKLYFDRNFTARMPKQSGFDIDKSKKLGEITRLMKRDKANITYGPGFIREQIGGYTKIIHLN